MNTLIQKVKEGKKRIKHENITKSMKKSSNHPEKRNTRNSEMHKQTVKTKSIKKDEINMHKGKRERKELNMKY